MTFSCPTCGDEVRTRVLADPVTLVVVGHNWYPAIDDSRLVKAAYLVVYTFHVPAFTPAIVLARNLYSAGAAAVPLRSRPARWGRPP